MYIQVEQKNYKRVLYVCTVKAAGEIPLQWKTCTYIKRVGAAHATKY